MNKLLIILLLLCTSIAHASKNRIIINDLGYSTATGGFISAGYGKSLDEGLAYLYIGSWSYPNENYYGVGYRHFINAQTSNSWILSGELSKNEVKNGDLRKSTMLIGLGGYQWVFNDSWAIDAQSGARFSDVSGINLILISIGFAYLF
jgi:hypothetical protein